MSDTKAGPTVLGGLQATQLAVTVVLAVLGFQLNREAEDSKQSIARLEAGIKQRQEDRVADQGADNLRVVLFEQVSKAIASKDERQVRAAQALVTALVPAEEPFRVGLLQALETNAPPGVKGDLGQTVQREREFLTLQRDIDADVAQARAGATKGPAASATRAYLIDIFHCEGGSTAAARLEMARRIEAALRGQVAQTRLRAWGESLNASPGYGVVGLQIRHNDDEVGAATVLAALLKAQLSLSFSLRRVSTPTPGYLSVFAC